MAGAGQDGDPGVGQVAGDIGLNFADPVAAIGVEIRRHQMGRHRKIPQTVIGRGGGGDRVIGRGFDRRRAAELPPCRRCRGAVPTFLPAFLSGPVPAWLQGAAAERRQHLRLEPAEGLGAAHPGGIGIGIVEISPPLQSHLRQGRMAVFRARQGHVPVGGAECGVEGGDLSPRGEAEPAAEVEHRRRRERMARVVKRRFRRFRLDPVDHGFQIMGEAVEADRLVKRRWRRGRAALAAGVIGEDPEAGGEPLQKRQIGPGAEAIGLTPDQHRCVGDGICSGLGCWQGIGGEGDAVFDRHVKPRGRLGRDGRKRRPHPTCRRDP